MVTRVSVKGGGTFFVPDQSDDRTIADQYQAWFNARQAYNLVSMAEDNAVPVEQRGGNSTADQAINALADITDVPGTLSDLAIGLDTASTTQSVISAPGTFGKALAGVIGFSTTSAAQDRRAALDAAQAPGATVGEMLSAQQERPSLADKALGILGGALSVAFADPIGTTASIADVKDQFASETQFDAALDAAAAAEQAAAATGLIGQGAGVGFGSPGNVQNVGSVTRSAVSRSEEAEDEAEDQFSLGEVFGFSFGFPGIGSQQSGRTASASAPGAQQASATGTQVGVGTSRGPGGIGGDLGGVSGQADSPGGGPGGEGESGAATGGR